LAHMSGNILVGADLDNICSLYCFQSSINDILDSTMIE
jgi:hypothetical protein